MRNESEAARIRYRRDRFLPWREAQRFRFCAPEFGHLASTIELHDLADAVHDEQCAVAIEFDSCGDKSCPRFLEVAFAVENLNPPVVPVADIDAPVGAYGD